MTATYQEVAHYRDRLHPWVRFIRDVSSDEVTEAIEAVFHAAERSISASNEDAAKQMLDIAQAEIERAREDWLPAAIDEYTYYEPAAYDVYERLCETGKLEWPKKPTNAEVKAQLDRCGQGTAESPWDTDGLVALAKMLRAKGF